MKVKLTSVFVNDPLEAFKFYTEVLGFIEKVYMPEAYLAIVVSPEDPDGTAILLEPNVSPVAKAYQQGVRDLNLPVIVFDSKDVQAEYERLRARGVAFTQEPAKTDFGTVAVFDDTCGNLIQIHQD